MSTAEVPGTGDGDLSVVTPVAMLAGSTPGAATAVGGVSGDRFVTVSWTAPAATGGSSILYYTVFSEPPPATDGTCGDAGDWDTCSALTGATSCQLNSKCQWDTTLAATHHCTVACTVVVQGATTIAVPGLTNGVWYRFTVTASSAIGTGPHSEWLGNCVGSATVFVEGSCTGSGEYWVSADEVHGGVSPGRPATAPLSPTAVSHPAGSAGIVSFTAPADDGGHTIIKYGVQAYSDSGATTAVGSVFYGDSSPITVNLLTDGVSYWFTVLASNSWSVLSLSSLPAEVPGTGDGDLSVISNELTSGASPYAPLEVAGTSADSSVTVEWTVPTYVGGGSTTLSYYTIFSEPPPTNIGTCGDKSDYGRCTAYTGRVGCEADSAGTGECQWNTAVAAFPHCTVACTVVTTSTSAAVNGLMNGVWYRFTVTATNPYGTGPHSEWLGNCVGSTSSRTEASCATSLDTTEAVSGGGVTAATAVTLASSNALVVPGQVVTGTGVVGTVTVASISGTSLVLSTKQSIADTVVLTFTAAVTPYWMTSDKVTGGVSPGKTLPLPCVSTAFAAKTSPLPCVSHCLRG